MLLICCSALLNAQAWTENFDDSTDLPTDWIVVNEGDDKTWEISNYGGNSPDNVIVIPIVVMLMMII